MGFLKSEVLETPVLGKAHEFHNFIVTPIRLLLDIFTTFLLYSHVTRLRFKDKVIIDNLFFIGLCPSCNLYWNTTFRKPPLLPSSGKEAPNPVDSVDRAYLFTLYSRVLLEKLTGSQLVKKFPELYGTRRFITAFTGSRHL